MAELVLEDARNELRGMLGFWGYYLSSQRACISRLFAISLKERDAPDDDDGAVVQNGARIVKQLMEMVMNMEDDDTGVVWRFLADIWMELLVYAAPSNDEEHVSAHADILPEGVEPITVLWAFGPNDADHHPHTRLRPTSSPALARIASPPPPLPPSSDGTGEDRLSSTGSSLPISVILRHRWLHIRSAASASTHRRRHR
ncbi:hypothetical protein HU200_053216 [Digitaria exilis]|uniref:Uncharacterized protein n=1 Tax=Digitaria exilis TaxID=1010633 RepID=A0A835APJ3_9POAL|nr:hypothetical protein HU200_053216 [Digitaria exilis]